MFKRNIIEIEWIGYDYSEATQNHYEVWLINGLKYHVDDLQTAIDAYTKYFSLWERLTMKIKVA